MLGIQRLLDPARNREGEQTLSLEALIRTIDSRTDGGLKKDLRERLKRLRVTAQDIREWRSRAIAHVDLDTRLKRHPKPLPSVKRRVIQQMIDEMAAFMNRVEAHFQRSTTNCNSVDSETDADILLYLLRRSTAHDEQPQARS